MIYRVLGSLLFIEALMLAMCLGLSYYYNEDDLFAFLIATMATLAGGFTFRYLGRESNNSLSRRDAFLLVTLSWMVFSLFGTLPFMLGGYITNFTDAYFETMSGFTTTGATIINDVESMPHAILFWRSLMQWIGGLGIVFFTIALLPSMTGGSVKVFAAEATGPIKSKLHPRLSTTAKWIWAIYTLLTALCIGSFYFFGMSFFDAVNHGMTTTATGGFSTRSDSADIFTSPAIEYTCVLFCFLSGLNYKLLNTVAVKRQLKRLWESSEFKLYIALILFFTLYILIQLVISNGYAIEKAFRSALFTVVSFMTSTGLFNDDAATWPHATWIVLLACMIVGGMSGSTSGGLKCIRIVMLFKIMTNEFRQMLHPNAVLPVNVNGGNVSHQRRSSLVALISMYIILAVLAVLMLAISGIDFTNAVTIIVSCLGNVGPTLETAIGPSMSWADLPAVSKWVCSFYMLLGRLEIFTVLVILTPAFWREN